MANYFQKYAIPSDKASDGFFLICVRSNALSRKVQCYPIKHVFMRIAKQKKGIGTTPKTQGGKINLFKTVRGTRCSKLTACHEALCNHRAVCPTFCLPSGTVTFLLQSSFRYNPTEGKESTFPARTSLCSLVPGDPHSLLLPRLCFLFYHIFSTSYFSSTLLHFLLRIISPSSVGVLSPGSYTSELQLDAHLNSESAPVCLFLLTVSQICFMLYAFN